MQKRLLETYGDREADRNHPYGFGPYKLKELVIGNRVVLEKNPEWKGFRPDTPDTVIYRLMREPEQRVTALAQRRNPDRPVRAAASGGRVESSARHRIVTSGSIEMMFLAMSPKREPWDRRSCARLWPMRSTAKPSSRRCCKARRGCCTARSPRPVCLRSQPRAEVQLRSGEGPGPGQAGRLSERRRCRAVHPGRPLHQRQAGLGSHGGDASRRRHSRRAEDAGMAHAVDRRAEGQGAVLLHGPRSHDQRRTGHFPVFRNR